jgi:hypothetical protein
LVFIIFAPHEQKAQGLLAHFNGSEGLEQLTHNQGPKEMITE